MPSRADHRSGHDANHDHYYHHRADDLDLDDDDQRTSDDHVVDHHDGCRQRCPNPESPPADPRAAEPLTQLGTIEIPKIGVTKAMYEGITLTTLDHGPGHWPGTAMPGQVGNVVIAGHRVSHDKPFRNLDKLVAGDDVILTTDDGRFDLQGHRHRGRESRRACGSPIRHPTTPPRCSPVIRRARRGNASSCTSRLHPDG